MNKNLNEINDTIISINRIEDNKYYIYNGISFYTEEALINYKRNERLDHILNDTEYKEKETFEITIGIFNRILFMTNQKL
jgi:hypothetical protein